MPRAALIALAVFLVAEAAVRLAPLRWVVPYVGAGSGTYPSLRYVLDAKGPAEVAIVGSSRARDAIAAPDLAAACTAALGRPVSVGNYASPAATADEVEYITHLLLAGERKPALVLYGISPEQLSALAAQDRRTVRMWRLADWRRDAAELPPQLVGPARSMALHNEVGHWCRLFAYRDSLWLHLRAWLGGEPRHSNPLLGELSAQHVSEPDARLSDEPRSDREVRNLLGAGRRGGRHELGGEALRHLDAFLSHCRRAGVQVALFEVPLSEPLRRNLPADTLERMRWIARSSANAHRVPLFTLEDLGESFDDTHFRDLSHVNLAGARKLSARVATEIVVPALENRLERVPRPLPALPPGRVGAVKLLVAAPNASAVAGAWVHLDSIEFGQSLVDWISQGTLAAPAGGLYTNSQGVFRIAGIPSGAYRYSVVGPDGGVAEGEVVVPPHGTARVEVELLPQ